MLVFSALPLGFPLTFPVSLISEPIRDDDYRLLLCLVESSDFEVSHCAKSITSGIGILTSKMSVDLLCPFPFSLFLEISDIPLLLFGGVLEGKEVKYMCSMNYI